MVRPQFEAIFTLSAAAGADVDDMSGLLAIFQIVAEVMFYEHHISIPRLLIFSL